MTFSQLYTILEMDRNHGAHGAYLNREYWNWKDYTEEQSRLLRDKFRAVNEISRSVNANMGELHSNQHLRQSIVKSVRRHLAEIMKIVHGLKKNYDEFKGVLARDGTLAEFAESEACRKFIDFMHTTVTNAREIADNYKELFPD